MHRYLTALLVALTLQGCSSDTPSTSDVEKAFEAEFAPCPSIEISDVKIINGVKVNDQIHQEEVSVTFNIQPIPQEKLDELHQREALQKQKGEELKILQSQISDLYTKVHELNDPRQYPQGNSTSMSSEYVEHRNQSDYPKLMADIKVLQDKVDTINGDRTFWKPVDYVQESGVAGCLSKIGQFDYKEAVTNGASYEYHGTLMMMQTDQGWMAAK